MEPVLFRGIETGFGFSEKVLVILHGLPVLNHRVHFLVVMWCAWGTDTSAYYDLYVNS